MDKIDSIQEIDEHYVRLMEDAATAASLCRENTLAILRALMEGGPLDEKEVERIVPHPDYVKPTLELMESWGMIRRWSE